MSGLIIRQTIDETHLLHHSVPSLFFVLKDVRVVLSLELIKVLNLSLKSGESSSKRVQIFGSEIPWSGI